LSPFPHRRGSNPPPPPPSRRPPFLPRRSFPSSMARTLFPRIASLASPYPQTAPEITVLVRRLHVPPFSFHLPRSPFRHLPAFGALTLCYPTPPPNQASSAPLPFPLFPKPVSRGVPSTQVLAARAETTWKPHPIVFPSPSPHPPPPEPGNRDNEDLEED